MNVKRNKGLIWSGVLLTLPMILLIAYIVFFFTTREYSVYPASSTITAYSDSSEAEKNFGQSVVKLRKSPEGSIHFSYILREKFQLPYAGVRIIPNGDKQYLNGSSYDYILINFDTTSAKSLRVVVRTHSPAFTDKDDEHSYRHLVQNFYLSQHAHSIMLPLKKCITPSWWLRRYKTSAEELGTESFSQIKDIELESGDLAPFYIEEHIRITSVTFVKSWTTLIISVICTLVLYIFLLIIALVMREKGGRAPVITYEKLDVQSHIDEDCYAVVNAISENYSNAELNLQMVSRLAGLGTVKISATLKRNFDMSFKEYLNNVRITEVKRLLCETDLQISEIYWKVGYQSRTNFHRVFKAFEGVSPQQYRQKMSVVESDKF